MYSFSGLTGLRDLSRRKARVRLSASPPLILPDFMIDAYVVHAVKQNKRFSRGVEAEASSTGAIRRRDGMERAAQLNPNWVIPFCQLTL